MTSRETTEILDSFIKEKSTTEVFLYLSSISRECRDWLYPQLMERAHVQRTKKSVNQNDIKIVSPVSRGGNLSD